MAAAVAAVHGGLLWLCWWPRARVLWGDEREYLRSAKLLLGGDPGWWPAPLWPPLYPCFVAGTKAVAGGSLVGVQLAQTLLLLVAAAVLGDLVRRWSGSAEAGWAAGALAAASPPLVAYAHYLWPEVLHLALMLAAAWLLAVRPLDAGRTTLAGVAVGLALLTKSLLTPLVPVLAAFAWWGRPVRRVVPAVLGFAAALAATVAPVVAVQWQRTGRLMIADSSAFNLWVGLNDTARRNFEEPFVESAWRRYLAGGDDWEARDAFVRREIARTVRGRSWLGILREQAARQYFRLLDRDGYLVDQLPGGAATRAPHPAGYVAAPAWAAVAVRAVARGWWALLLVAAPLGFALWRPAHRRWSWAMAAFVAYSLALFLLLHVKTRYRIQLLPVLFAGAGALVAWWSAGRPAPSRLAVATAGSAAVVLLLLAFGGAWL